MNSISFHRVEKITIELTQQLDYSHARTARTITITSDNGTRFEIVLYADRAIQLDIEV